MRNRHPGNCLRCGTHVEAGMGYFQRVNGAWKVRCLKCVGKGNEPVRDGNVAEKTH